MSTASGSPAKAAKALKDGTSVSDGVTPIAVSQPLKLSWSGSDGEWTATCEAINCDVHVSRRGGGSGSMEFLFLHGSDPDRSSRCFEAFLAPFVEAGHSSLSIDMPGHGASTGERKAREGVDDDLLLAVLQSFSIGEASVIAEGGGAAPFLRALVKVPAAFGAHHVLLNPVIAAVPDALQSTVEKAGIDFFFAIADQWCDGDPPNRAAMCSKMFKWFETAPDRVELVLLRPVRGAAMLPTMRPPEWLTATVGGGGFAFVPHVDMLGEVLGYLTGPRRASVKPQGTEQAPTKSALELGHENVSFRVFVRIRPLLSREEEAEAAPCISVSDVANFPREPPPQRVTVTDPRLGDTVFSHHTKRGEFVFDRAFMPASQEDLFEAVGAPLVQAVLDGTNATIFAYGQTGTGKTWTMEGPNEQPGLTSRAVRALYTGLGDGRTVYVQYVQLYDEHFLDLLDPPEAGGGGKKLAVAEAQAYTFVRGATLSSMGSADEALAAITRGAAFRAHGKTNMNDASSRSHAILLLIVAPTDQPVESGNVLYMVDLAGSERQKRSGVTGQGLSEMIANNAALSSLGRVVSSLVEKDGHRAAHIGYKDNPLTDLLKCGIGGNSRTALVACLTAASDSLDESLNTLRFATQCSHVKNKVAAKDKKDEIKAKAADIESTANQLTLVGGAGVIELPGNVGTIEVRGSWGDPSLPAIILLADSDHSMGWGSEDPSQFDELTALLAERARVLCPKLGWGTKDKEPNTYVPKLLALCDWLGLAKPVVYGRDCGALVAIAFKITHPGRCGPLVLENARDRYDEVEFKKRMKKDPSIAMGSIGGPWSLIIPLNVGKEPSFPGGLKKFKGKAVVLWPNQMKGKPNSAGCMMKSLGEMIPKHLKGATLVDSASWRGFEPLAAELRKVLPGAG